MEFAELLAVIPRGGHKELRIRRLRLVTGIELIDVRIWRKTWRGQVPDKGLALLPGEAPLLAAALEKAGKA